MNIGDVGRTRLNRIKELKNNWYDHDGVKKLDAPIIVERLLSETDFLLADNKALRECLTASKEVLYRMVSRRPLTIPGIELLITKINAVLESTK